ncbi:beta carbonic anhydrase 5, chloroplastic isoform X2 [Macadamia integrifolia]|uniref:beta carbonic anhydrase 5, chloroplastic isoform X2 n=1 Tax=Macadamia integrifolia TaxID=60698 RepID=UPI001C4F5C0B|nr:beta carbonic anhydrase 5, chloroplastic isoform X2 [Macadamia integrifolia]
MLAGSMLSRSSSASSCPLTYFYFLRFLRHSWRPNSDLLNSHLHLRFLRHFLRRNSDNYNTHFHPRYIDPDSITSFSIWSSKTLLVGSEMAAQPHPPWSLFQESLFSSSIARPTNSFVGLARSSIGTSNIYGSQKRLAKSSDKHLRVLFSVKSNQPLAVEASREMTQQMTNNETETLDEVEHGLDVFADLKHRFLNFKKHKYLENSEHFELLAKAQAPKFMVIACADSRVCPSNILGFQPGEAFMIRNVANLVPPLERGPSETNAALEFAVNSLEVKNILVIGHSCCGGIRALMSMQDEEDSSLIRNWVVIGKPARASAKAAAAHLCFDQQCSHCEKDSVNCSLANLLTYPWIEERVHKGFLSIHGGYYDFTNCSFEKWTLDYKGSSIKEEGSRHAIKDQAFWC